jgi:hypothetical protein
MTTHFPLRVELSNDPEPWMYYFYKFNKASLYRRLFISELLGAVEGSMSKRAWCLLLNAFLGTQCPHSWGMRGTNIHLAFFSISLHWTFINNWPRPAGLAQWSSGKIVALGRFLSVPSTEEKCVWPWVKSLWILCGLQRWLDNGNRWGLATSRGSLNLAKAWK